MTPVPALVQEDVTHESGQENLVQEVSTWGGGGYRQAFSTPASLAAAVTRGLLTGN